MKLTKIGRQLGSNEGGQYRDIDTGKSYYVKHYKNADQAKTEVLTAKIYHHMGIPTTNPEYTEMGGKPTVYSEWHPELKVEAPEKYDHLRPDQAESIGRLYHAGVLTKNWDIVGLEHDNIVTDDKGTIHSVDQGGAMHFRARGGAKDYDPDIAEHRSLRDNNGASGHVFSSVFSKHPTAERKSLDAVTNIDDRHVENLFRNSGLDNWRDLHKSFQSRKTKLLKHYNISESVIPMYHPKGKDVKILFSSKSSPSEHWDHPDHVGSITPEDYSSLPKKINGISTEAIDPPKDWTKVQSSNFHEPLISISKTHDKKLVTGTLMVENGKVWVVHPTNEFGGYSATFPKGKVEYKHGLHQNALKETFEETGLHANLTGHAIDVPRTTSYARYYFAKRTGGNPADMGWESQKVSLVPIKDLHKVVTHPADQPIVNLLQNGIK